MLTQTTGYAITALTHIASHAPHAVLVKDIAAQTNIPRNYLAKIIHNLARKGFVLTQRGIGGGATLAFEPHEITLYEICLALHEPVVTLTCMLGNAECSDERACPSHDFWTAHREEAIKFLNRTTLKDMVDFERRRAAEQPAS